MKTSKVVSSVVLGFLPGPLVAVLTLAVITFFAAGPAMAGKSKYPVTTRTTFSSTYHLVPAVDSPEPTASGTATEEDGYTASNAWPGPTVSGWSDNSVKCRGLTPAKQYQIICEVEIGSTRFMSDRLELRTYSCTADKQGRLNAQFSILGGYFEDYVRVLSLWTQDDAGNVVLVRSEE